MATYTPPEKQKFSKTVNDYLGSATQAVSGRYDTRISGEQANLPLIQDQYRLLAENISKQKDQQLGSMTKSTENQIGSSRLANALNGIFSSSENKADERNIKDDFDVTSTNLVTNTNNTLSQAQLEADRQRQAIENVIRNLQSDKESDIQNQAWQMYDTDYQRHEAEQAAAYQRYIDAYNAQVAREQAEFERKVADREYSLKAGSANPSGANRTAALMSDLMAGVPEGGNAQDYVYRQILANGNLWAKDGINVEDLWNAWRNMKYGAQYSGKSQAEIDLARKIAERSARVQPLAQQAQQFQKQANVRGQYSNRFNR